MLTLKIRIPYKEGKAEDIIKDLEPYLNNAVFTSFKTAVAVDGKIQIDIFNGNTNNKTLDLRLLEIKEGE